MLLTPHFSLEELTVTSRRDIDNTPTPEARARLLVLCTEILEPLRARFGPLRINSGYRSPALNAVIPGSARNSAHLYGCAADVAPPAGVTVRDMLVWIRDESGLPYDQVIDELKGTGAAWLHVGMLRPGYGPEPRREALVMRNGAYSTFA